MRIVTLAENTSALPDIGSEHGLSLYIEANGHRLLFDTGQTDLFAKNAEKLNIDLSKVDIAVLSHGHYDHGGGIAEFLRLNETAPVFLNRHAFEPHYNGKKYIGLDPGLKESGRLVFTDDEYSIGDGMTLYSCNDRERRYGASGAGLLMKNSSVLSPDDFRHEHYLLIEEDGKRVLISGCSHKGILNIMQWFKPDYLVGGFHFMKLPCSDELADYANLLEDYDTTYYTCHCTGVEQYEFMKRHMSRLHYLSAGEKIEI